MTPKVGIDTSIVIGLLDERDVWHARSVALLEALEAANMMTTYFDCVMAEAISTLSRRLHEKRRDADLNMLVDRLLAQFPAEDLFWITPEIPKVYTSVIELIRHYSGELNFNDALLAIACRDYDIPLLASFDPDFDKVPWLKRISAPENVNG